MITGVTMEETRFTDSIERLTMTASLGSVAGINVFDVDTVSDCFVFDEMLELIITPSTEYSIESLTSTLILDTFKVLHYDSSCLAVAIDNSFADDVVHISHKMFPSAAQYFEMSFCRFRSFTLETCMESADAFEFRFDSTIELPVGCNGEFAYTNINPDQVQAVSEFNVFGNKNMYEIIFTFLNDVSTACIPINILREVFRDSNGYFDSTFNGGNTNNIFIEFRPEVADVVSDRNVLHSFGFPILCNDFDCLTGQLGRQFGFSSDDAVAFIVETLQSSDMSVVESYLNGFIELDICFRNRDISWKSNTNSGFGLHTTYIDGEDINIYRFIGTRTKQKTASQFLHRINTVASLRPMW